MAIETQVRNQTITSLLNGTFLSMEKIIPIEHQFSKPRLLVEPLHLEYGVLIGITGDVRGNLVLAANAEVFAEISQLMYGMALEGDMLKSFSGELGNMIAGNLSTIIVNNGINTEITAPTIIQGDTTLSGHKKGIQLSANFKDAGVMEVYLLLNL